MMVKHPLTTALLLLSCFSVANSAVTWFWGRCPEVTVKPDFDVNQYLGTWYEVARYPNAFEDDEAACTQAVYSPSEKGSNYITVTNSGILPDGTVDSVVGEAWIPDPNEPGKLLVRFSRFQPPGDYWVLDTDYDKYSVVHSCQDFFIFHIQTDWFLSQYRQATQTTLDQVYNIFEANDVSTDPLFFTNQEGCDEDNEVPAE